MTPDQTARLERIQTVEDVLSIIEDYGWSAEVMRALSKALMQDAIQYRSLLQDARRSAVQMTTAPKGR